MDAVNNPIRFTPPTYAEVAAYAAAENLADYSIDFVDYFESNGWRVGGKAPMKNWKAAYRRWCRMAPQFNSKPAADTRKAGLATQYAADYIRACKNGDDNAKYAIKQKVKAEGLDWEQVTAEITRQSGG